MNSFYFFHLEDIPLYNITISETYCHDVVLSVNRLNLLIELHKVHYPNIVHKVHTLIANDHSHFSNELDCGAALELSD